MSTAKQKLTALLSVARNRMDIKSYTHLQTSTAFWVRYYDFLVIVLERYRSASERYISTSKQTMGEVGKSGNRSLGPEGWQKLLQMREVTLALHLEIESFYVFGKILLDRIADTFGFVFGRPWEEFGSTHSRLAKDMETLVRTLSLEGDVADLQDLARQLKDRIVDFRTREIEHQDQSGYVSPGVSWDREGRSSMIYALVRPEAEKGMAKLDVKTEDPSSLLASLDRYMAMMLDFLEPNISMMFRGQTTTAQST